MAFSFTIQGKKHKLSCHSLFPVFPAFGEYGKKLAVLVQSPDGPWYLGCCSQCAMAMEMKIPTSPLPFPAVFSFVHKGYVKSMICTKQTSKLS